MCQTQCGQCSILKREVEDLKQINNSLLIGATIAEKVIKELSRRNGARIAEDYPKSFYNNPQYEPNRKEDKLDNEFKHSSEKLKKGELNIKKDYLNDLIRNESRQRVYEEIEKNISLNGLNSFSDEQLQGMMKKLSFY
jgi:hypothetical protein